MTIGCRIRRTATGFAALTIAALTGCHTVPVARIAPSPNRPQSALAAVGRATLFPATVAMEPPSEMSSIEPVSSGATSEPAPGRLELSSPAIPVPVSVSTPVTPPLQDEALVQARGVEAMVAEEIARASVPPAPEPEPETGPAPEPVPTGELPEPDSAHAETLREVKAAEPPRPEDLWRDGVRQLVTLARARGDEPGGSGTPWGLRSRVLAWLAEPEIVPDVSLHEADDVRAVLHAMEDVPSDSQRDGEDFRAAVRVIEDRAPLEIVDLRLCSKVERFGDFEPFEPPIRKAGQEVAIYAEVDGLHHEPIQAGFRTRLAAQVEILAEAGGSPILTLPLGTAEEVCRRRRRDYYIAYRLVLPRSLVPGDYRLRLTEKDLASDRSATREVPFGIAPG
ncbi:hypothetical protein P12x_003173 [Tundrisphaera lichenicola]|uniref:hypothetical protein n=1 Tax=Tundrisphaera lichenicola TaxID=2029860 RepID=UPI003EBB1D2A